MAIKTQIIAILIATVTLVGCAPTPVFEDPDEPITRKEYYESQQQHTANAVLAAVITSYFLAAIFAVVFADIAAEAALDQHKIDDHGFTQS